MSRRYEIGIHPEYDQRYEVPLNYTFLNMRINTVAGIQRIISEFQPIIDQRQQDIAAIDLKFENLKVTARRQGRPEPAGMPQQLLIEKLQLEARIDAIAERVAQCEKDLAEAEAREQAEQDAKILQYGPIGSSKGDPLSIIDGQPIRVKRSGILVIDCPKSPYHKMLVENYRAHVIAPFAKARSQKSREYDDAIAEKERELRELRKLKPELGGIIAREDLPPRPKGF